MKIRGAVDIHKMQLVIALLSGSALLGSYVLEYGLYLVPCSMCLYARQLWKITAVVSLLAFLLPPVRNVPRVNHWGFRIVLVLLLVNVGIALAHFGMERHWWHDFVSSCRYDSGSSIGVSDLVIKSCSDADYIHVNGTVIPVSVTAMSLIYASFSLFCLLIWRCFNSFRTCIFK